MSAVNELVITPKFVTNIIAVDCAEETTFTTADKAKLNGIEAGAQVNTVTRVAGKTGVVELNAGDIAYDASETYASGKIGAALKSAEEKLDTINAGDIGYDGSTVYDTGTVGEELTHLNRQLSDTKSALVNQGIHFFPEAMKADVADYETVQPSLITENARYASAGNLVTDATGFCAVKVDVMPYDQLYVNGASVGYDGTYRVYMMSGDTLVSSLGVGAEYTPYFSIPEGIDNIRFTCTLNGYNQNALFIRLLSYASIASKEYAENTKTKSVIPFTDLTITDNYRVGPSGNLIQANGYYSIEFDTKPGEIVWFFRSLLGYNTTFNIVLMFDNTVKSIITDSGITGQAGKYKLIVPDGINKIKATGSMANKYPYNILKEQILDDGAISGNNYTNGQTTYIVGNGYFPTIQSACDFADANDIIYIKNGIYTEQVSIWGKKLNLIGENKLTTILIDHSGAYSTPPLEMNLGSLSNMTIIEDGSSPTLQPGDSGYNGAYCLHIEWSTPANEVFEIDNCNFINYIHAPLGCGLYQDYTVRFKDCTFRCEAANEGNMERGAFYFHSNVNPNVTGQKIIAENCIISSAGQKWAVLLGVPSGANNTGSAEATFTGCDIWNDNLGTADSIAYFDTSGGTDVLKVVNSCGNTVGILNSFPTDIYAQVSQLSNAIGELNRQTSDLESNVNTLNSYFKQIEQLLKLDTITTGRYWDIYQGKVDWYSNSGTTQYARIALNANETYTFINVYGYFTWIAEEDGTPITRITQLITKIGTYEYTPTQNCFAYVTKVNAANNVMVVNTNEDFPTEYVEGVYKTVLTIDENKNLDIIVKQDGTGDYDNIVSAVKFANTIPGNSEVNIYIFTGDYNILQELGGQDFINTIESSTNERQGLVLLRNNLNLIGVGDVILRYEMPDSVTYTQSSRTSCLNLREFSNKIENLTLIAKNCRYAIHDETNGGNPYITRSMKNIRAIHKGNASGLWEYPSVLGGGAGGGSDYTFIDCQFITNSHNLAWSYHTNYNQEAAHFNVDGCVGIVNDSNGYSFRLSYHGTGRTGITVGNIKCCSGNGKNIVTAESTGDTDNNIEMYVNGWETIPLIPVTGNE